MKQRNRTITITASIILLICWVTENANAQAGALFVTAYGYDSCIQLKNEKVEVILEPNAGGRVIRYAMNGVNVLYEDSTQNGWTSSASKPRSKGHLAGGRFDIGPSRTKINTDLFFFGKWKAVITGKLSARLISQTDAVTQIYLIRDFILDEHTSRLTCTQTIVNKGANAFSASFWSRTFAVGNGICVMPVPENGRFPNRYVMFMNRDTINMLPVDSNISVHNGYLIIKGPPQKPKLEMDVASPAWISYAVPDNLLFVKKFNVYQNRTYGDVTAANASIWYNGMQMTEIEPIGPVETVLPGHKTSFTEVWYLSSFIFPAQRNINVEEIKKITEHL